jgi:hypothetical protein
VNRCLIAIVVVCTGLHLATPVRADDADPAAAFQAASAAFEKKDYVNAARLFERANSVSPHPAAIVNAAAAWEASGNKGLARFRYEQALATGALPDARKREVERKLVALAAQTGSLRIEGSPRMTASVSGYEKISPPARIYLAPGTHEITITSADGKTSTRTVELRAERDAELMLEEPPAPAAPVVPPPPPRSAPPAPSPPPSEQGERSSTQQWIGVGFVGAGVVAAGASVFLGVATVDARDDYYKSGRDDEHLYDKATTLRTATNVAWIAGAVLAGAGVVLWLTSPRPSPSTRASGPVALRF